MNKFFMSGRHELKNIECDEGKMRFILLNPIAGVSEKIILLASILYGSCLMFLEQWLLFEVYH